MRKNKIRKFEIVLRDLDTAKIVMSQIKGFYQIGKVTRYAFALHDKDIYIRGDEIPTGKKIGDPKTAHWHMGFVWYNAITFGTVSNLFAVPENFIEKIKSKFFGDYFAYLTHANRPEKHQYPDSIVITSEPDWKTQRDARLAANSAKSQVEFFPYWLQQATEGKLKRSDVGGKIPKISYVQHKAQYDNAFQLALESQAEQINLKGISKEIIFISGGSGAGKTTYAKSLAVKKGYSFYISSSSNDVLDGYAGEDCLILDDARGSQFTFADFLKLVDPHSASSFDSRYHNKLIVARLIIVTTVQNLDQFIATLQNSEGEELKQVRRRVAMQLHLTKDTATPYVYDEIADKYVEKPARPNRALEFAEQHQEEFNWSSYLL
ncbi:MAG: hypothetical protein H9W81_15875 [Enterococcus sp.]|nr:hypothetical protein [Enterococcus sp.]